MASKTRSQFINITSALKFIGKAHDQGILVSETRIAKHILRNMLILGYVHKIGEWVVITPYGYANRDL